MAIEIAVRISGKGRAQLNQAIFIQESELQGSLSEARTIIAKQDIEVPNEYRFLSQSGNIIPWAIEESLLLSTFIDIATSKTKSSSKSDDAVKSEIVDEDSANQHVTGVPELWLYNVEESQGSSDPTVGADGREQPQVDKERKENETSTSTLCLCPWKSFTSFVHDGNSPRNLFKILFFLVVILFMMLISLVLTTHLLFGTLSSISASPEFNSLVSKFRSDGGNVEELTNLRVKVSEMELTWKYKVDQLNGKLMELEELYLNDLAVHKRELSSLKSRQVDLTGTFASQIDLDALATRFDRLLEYMKALEDSRAGDGHQEKKKEKKNKHKEGA